MCLCLICNMAVMSSFENVMYDSVVNGFNVDARLYVLGETRLCRFKVLGLRRPCGSGIVCRVVIVCAILLPSQESTICEVFVYSSAGVIVIDARTSTSKQILLR